MKWSKKGLIYCPDGEHIWEKDTFMTPQPILLNDEVIRVYGGVRDNEGVSRIKWIDVRADDLSKVIAVADKPCLDIGLPGCFDDNGVILGDVLKVENKLYMYYVAFQHVQKAKFYAFSGLAICEDLVWGEFERVWEVPVMDRTNTGKFGRCIHTVLYEEGIFKIYYAVIHGWKNIGGIDYPAYNIWRTESQDGIHIPNVDDCLCVDVNEKEYRIGRPKVYKTGQGYEMFYTRDFITKEYVVGYATSNDGIHWERKDELAGLYRSENGWDSEMACYPAMIVVGNQRYMFYNGNGMGKTGVGYAILDHRK